MRREGCGKLLRGGDSVFHPPFTQTMQHGGLAGVTNALGGFAIDPEKEKPFFRVKINKIDFKAFPCRMILIVSE